MKTEEKPKLQTMMIFSNGAIACFDDQDGQVSELQVSALTLWGEHAEKLGYDIDGLRIETSQENYVMRKDPDNGTWRGLLK